MSSGDQLAWLGVIGLAIRGTGRRYKACVKPRKEYKGSPQTGRAVVSLISSITKLADTSESGTFSIKR